jgi:membrane protein implicated in regulation of membrane protease activity
LYQARTDQGGRTVNQLFDSYAWIVWLALILLFVIIEMVNLEFTFLMLALGSTGGLVSGLFGAPWWLQIIVAAVLSVILIFLVRPPLLRALRKDGDPTKSNVDALIGLAGRVLITVTITGGQVKLANGETWTARLSPAALGPLPESAAVTVLAIDGATAIVAAEE